MQLKLQIIAIMLSTCAICSKAWDPIPAMEHTDTPMESMALTLEILRNFISNVRGDLDANKCSFLSQNVFLSTLNKDNSFAGLNINGTKNFIWNFIDKYAEFGGFGKSLSKHPQCGKNGKSNDCKSVIGHELTDMAYQLRGKSKADADQLTWEEMCPGKDRSTLTAILKKAKPAAEAEMCTNEYIKTVFEDNKDESGGLTRQSEATNKFLGGSVIEMLFDVNQFNIAEKLEDCILNEKKTIGNVRVASFAQAWSKELWQKAGLNDNEKLQWKHICPSANLAQTLVRSKSLAGLRFAQNSNTTRKSLSRTSRRRFRNLAKITKR